MSTQTTERVFETYVEEILLSRSGWNSGEKSEWDKERALFQRGYSNFYRRRNQNSGTK
jgi:hypothetical protein